MTNMAHDFEKACNPFASFVMSMQQAGKTAAEMASTTMAKLDVGLDDTAEHTLG